MAFEAKTGAARHRSRMTDKAIEEVTKQPLTGFHVQLPEELHKSFKAKTALKGEKMKDVVERLIREYVEKD